MSALIGSSSPLVEALTRVNVDATLAASMGDTLARNDLKLFEQLANDVMSNNRTEVGSVLRTHLDHMVHDNKLFESVQLMTGDSASGVATVAFLGTVVFALIFKDGVPLTLVLLVLVLMFGAILLVQHVKSYIEQLEGMIGRLSKPQTSVLACVRRAHLQDSFHSKLLQMANTTEDVSLAVMNKLMSMQALSVMHCVVEVCGKVVSSFQGRMDGGASFSGLAEDKAAARRRVTEEINKMQESRDHVRQCIRAAVQSVVKTCEHAERWSNEVKAFESSLGRQVAKLPRRPDCFLTSVERDKKATVCNFIQEDAKDLDASLTNGLKEIDCQCEVDVELVQANCDTMIRALAFSPEMAAAQKLAVEEAVKNRALVSSALWSAVSGRTAQEVKIRDLECEMQIAAHTFNTKHVEAERSLLNLKDTLRKLGEGTVTMTGTPPRNDAIAQKLRTAWMAGRWKDLHPYRSGSFSIVIDSNLTPRQQEGKANMDRIVDKIDELKTEHQANMERMDRELSTLRNTIHIKRDAEKQAEAALDKAKAKDEKTWSDFCMSNPAEFSEIRLLYEINDCILKVAHWSFKVDPGLAEVRALKKGLTRTDDPASLQVIVQGLRGQLEAPNESAVAFVKSIGGFHVRQALMPKIGNLAEVKRLMDDFNKSEAQASRLADTAMLVD